MDQNLVERPIHGGLVVALLAAVALCGGCDSESSSTGKTSPTRAPAVGTPISAHYVLTYPSEDEYRIVYDVVTVGDERTRMTETAPSDPPVTIYRMVWDGRRILVKDNESSPPFYGVYEAPAEHRDLLHWVTSWIVDPRSPDFARECPDAQPLDATRTIAGRRAIGFRCYLFGERATLWLDEETKMLLSQNRMPSEGAANGLLQAERVSTDPRIDETTFSTDPPPGAHVKVIKATGKVPPPEEIETEKSVADLDKELRKIAATTKSTIPIYYVGTEFRGEPLSEVVIFNNASGSEAVGDHTLDAGQSLSIFYGDNGFEMYTELFHPMRYRQAVGCGRLPSLRGVPTVRQSDGVWLFTANFVIRLGSSAGAPKKAAAAATALREVGQSEPTGANLPAPPAHVVALVDKACGQKPGDRGPTMGEELGEPY